jgi:hypothetical protein
MSKKIKEQKLDLMPNVFLAPEKPTPKKCPCCSKHCKLKKPHCKKGKRLAAKLGQ